MSSLPTQVFGCVSLVHSHSHHRGKLDPQAIECILIDYPSNKKGYKCYHLQSRRVYVSMDVTLHEIELLIQVLNFTGRVVYKLSLLLSHYQYFKSRIVAHSGQPQKNAIVDSKKANIVKFSI